MTEQTEDLTLEEVRLKLAPEIALAAIFDGWSDAALLSAAEGADVDPAIARLAFPASGPHDRVARRNVPFADRTESRVEIGPAFGDAAEFKGGPSLDPPCNRFADQLLQQKQKANYIGRCSRILEEIFKKLRFD